MISDFRSIIHPTSEKLTRHSRTSVILHIPCSRLIVFLFEDDINIFMIFLARRIEAHAGSSVTCGMPPVVQGALRNMGLILDDAGFNIGGYAAKR